MAARSYKQGACSFIPKYVFEDIAASEDVEEEVKDLAKATLRLAELQTFQKELDELLTVSDEEGQIEKAAQAQRENQARPKEQADQVRQQIQTDQNPPPPQQAALAKPGLTRKVYTLASKQLNLDDATVDLVGQAQLVRSENNPASTEDQAANKCYEHFGDVYSFFSDVFGRNSIDNNGMPLVGMVHYGSNVANAMWDPTRNLMWFGDGFSHDAVDVNKPAASFAGYFGDFSDCLELVAHELFHGITTSMMKVTAGPCDSGAIVEHIADVFGIMVKQHKLKQTVKDADWLIGEDIILPELKGMALRSFKDPGNAYVLPNNLGQDKQYPHYKQYVPYADPHVNSGILNHAFYLAAMDIGGYSWEKLGKIWWKTLTEGQLNLEMMDDTWVPFGRKTVEFAQEYGQDVRKAVSNAWQSVGIQL